MNTDYKHLIETHILDEEMFLNATFSGEQRGQETPWERVTLRPVLLKDKRHLQFSYLDKQKDVTKNFQDKEAADQLQALLALPFKNINVQTTRLNVRVQMTKKGKAIIHREPVQQAAPDLAHDRQKAHILAADEISPFLQQLGIMTQAGKIRSHMRGKFNQLNEFLKLFSQVLDVDRLQPPTHVVDCGCGSAYLTFAVYHYLNHILDLETHITGIDLKADLLEKRSAEAEALGWSRLQFQASQIIDFEPEAAPDITLALHACDTATDEALFQGITWESSLILAAPCCHHHLQNQLKPQAPFEPVLRQGILKERLGDILTDTFRALILRIMGYRTDVIEFVSSEHTAKNLLIRAVKTGEPGQAQFVQEYQALKSFWQVTPYLEELLGEEFSQFLS